MRSTFCFDGLSRIRRRPRSFIVGILCCGAVCGLYVAQSQLCPTSGGELCKFTAGSYFTLLLTLSALLLMCNDFSPDFVLLGCTALLMLTGVISNEAALKGFCSSSVLAIGAMFPIARALEEVQAVDRVIRPILGRPRGPKEAILRLTAPTWALSMFLANTPLVATMISPCERWAASTGIPIKCLLMPLSFASMLGGMCTLIGTSTNLVLNSQIEQALLSHPSGAATLPSLSSPPLCHRSPRLHSAIALLASILSPAYPPSPAHVQDPNAPVPTFGMFSMSIVAIPASAIALLVLMVLGPRLLVSRHQTSSATTASNASSDVERSTVDTVRPSL